jgi:O-antigen/teichoic acid export membrane protein
MIRSMSLASHQTDKTAPPRKRESIAQSLAHYTPSVLFRNVVGILNTFIRPKLLNPQCFGLWSLLNTIPSYTCYLHLGSRDYMRFAIPRLEGLGDEEAALRVEASVFWGALVPNAGVAAALLVLAAAGRWLTTEMRIGLAAMAVLVVLTCVYEYCVNLMKGRQMFRDLSRGMYLRNASQLILSVLLMLYMGIYGLYIALPAAIIISLFYLRTRYPFERVGRFSWPVYLDMVREGYPLAIFAFLMNLMVSSGRLLVAGYLSTEEVGYYALSTLALSGMLDFPGAAREVIEPRIMEEAHTLHDPSVLDRYIYRPLVINACYLPLIIAPLYFLIPPLIEWLLPLYVKGIAPLQAVLFGFYFLAVFYPLRGIIVACHRQKEAALLTALGVLINVGFSLIALKTGFGILGVSVANSASYAVLLLLMAGLLYWRCGIRFPIAKVWPVMAAFLLLCAAVWASRTLIQPLTGGGFMGAIIQSTLLVGLGFVLVTLAEYKIPLLRGLSPLSILRTMVCKRPGSNSPSSGSV